jgi:thioesterase domain-containing protein
VIAFEMARQLQSRGESQEVSLLALIDSTAPGVSQENRVLDDELDLVLSFGQDLGLSVDGFNISREELWTIPVEDQLGYLLEMARAADIVPPDLELRDVKRLFAVFKTNLKAVQAYRPPRCDVGVTLFRAAQRLGPPIEDPTLGWGRVANHGVQVFEAPGTHYTIMDEPNLRVLAERLRFSLDGANPVLQAT